MTELIISLAALAVLAPGLFIAFLLLATSNPELETFAGALQAFAYAAGLVTCLLFLLSPFDEPAQVFNHRRTASLVVPNDMVWAGGLVGYGNGRSSPVLPSAPESAIGQRHPARHARTDADHPSTESPRLRSCQ